MITIMTHIRILYIKIFVMVMYNNAKYRYDIVAIANGHAGHAI